MQAPAAKLGLQFLPKCFNINPQWVSGSTDELCQNSFNSDIPGNSCVLDFADLVPSPTNLNDIITSIPEEVDFLLSDVLPMVFATETEGSPPPPPKVPSNNLSLFPATPTKQRSPQKHRILDWDPVKALSEDISPSKGSARRFPKKIPSLEPILEANVFLGGNTSNTTESTKPSQSRSASSQSRSTTSSQLQSQSSNFSSQTQGPFLMFLKTASKILSQYLAYDTANATVRPVLKRLGNDGLPNITVSMAGHVYVHRITPYRPKIGNHWKTRSRCSTKHSEIVLRFCLLSRP